MHTIPMNNMAVLAFLVAAIALLTPLYGKVRDDIRKPKEIAEHGRSVEGSHTNPIVNEMVDLKRETIDVEIMDTISVEKKRPSLKPIPKDERLKMQR